MEIADAYLYGNGLDGSYIRDADRLQMNGVISGDNGSNGVFISDPGMVTIQNVLVADNYYDGLRLVAYTPDHTGLVWIDGITAASNGDNGLDIYGDSEYGGFIDNLFLDNANVYGNGWNIYEDGYSDGTWIGNVNYTNITNSTFFGNYGDQLDINNDQYAGLKATEWIPQVSTVNIKNVTVDGMGNGYAGIEVGGFGHPQVVTLDNVSVKNTSDDGIFLYGNSKVDIKNVEATNNGWDCGWDYCAGLFLEDNGSINIANSTFNNNRNAGIWIDNWDLPFSAHDLAIYNVQTNNNGTPLPLVYEKNDINPLVYDAYGIIAYNVFDNVVISKTSAAGNGTGIYVETEYGIIALDHVNANTNRIAGAILNSGSFKLEPNGYSPETSYYIRCSKFNHNGNTQLPAKGAKYGGGLFLSGGNDALLDNVSAHGNFDGSGNFDIIAEIGGELVMMEGENCKVVPVVVGGACEAQNANLELANGDKATLGGLCSGSMALNAVTADGLPGALTEGETFVDGLVTSYNGESNALLPEGGSIVVTMTVPEGVDTANLTVLYWDAGAGAWVEVPLAGNESAFSASNGGVVISGVVFNDDGTLSFTVNFSGTFVVVSK